MKNSARRSAARPRLRAPEAVPQATRSRAAADPRFRKASNHRASSTVVPVRINNKLCIFGSRPDTRYRYRGLVTCRPCLWQWNRVATTTTTTNYNLLTTNSNYSLLTTHYSLLTTQLLNYCKATHCAHGRLFQASGAPSNENAQRVNARRRPKLRGNSLTHCFHGLCSQLSGAPSVNSSRLYVGRIVQDCSSLAVEATNA